ncbi:hypothetical protein Lepto7376_4319 [[Leptolyngbya] sp. PCC 7376]|uniref:hypothetical protein n=1 Tax=[Leptolyngbya] sp. PCC 7376 TaxID=111781 RepID=UPI00029F1B07|nr:hypothetical protein [[Leptolyngbya] sp. PCC 7376]AFY40428.1 hypothetical protein Lepto7376_4319 [[Leptolyngbya] sp. PCC 7376]
MKLFLRSTIAALSITPFIFALPAAIAQTSENAISESLGNFNPVTDGFSFTNVALTQQIKETYKTDRAAQNAINTEAMIFMFGPEVCLAGSIRENSTDNCVLTAAAKRWLSQNIGSMKNGVCEGIALSSLFLWLGRNDASNWDRPNTVIIPMAGLFTDGKEGTSRAKDIALTNPSLHTYTSLLFSMQSLKAVYKNANTNRTSQTPSQLLTAIKNSFTTKSTFNVVSDPLYTIGIYKVDTDNKLSQGHTLLPYKIEQTGDGIAKLFVYDSNYTYGNDISKKQTDPNSTFIEFNGNQWSYAPPGLKTAYRGDKNTKNLDISLLSKRDPASGFHDCAFCRSGIGAFEIDLLGSANMTVKNLATNRPVDNSNTIPFKGGLDLDVPPLYVLNANGSYQISLIGKTATNIDEFFEGESYYNDTDFLSSSDLVVTGANISIGAEELDLDTGEKAEIFVNSRQNNNTNSIPTNQVEFTLQASTSGDSPAMFSALDEANTSYDILVEPIELNPNNSILMRVDSSEQFIYLADDNGKEDIYIIDLARTSLNDNNSKSSEEEIYAEITVPADQALIFDYGSWEKDSENLTFYLVSQTDLKNTKVSYLSFETNKLQNITQNASTAENRVTRGTRRKGR